jgi:hypothetical protein
MSRKLLATLLVASISFALHANEDQQQPETNSFTGKVVGSKVRLRTHPSLDSHVVCETRSGELFAVNGEEGEYYTIQPKKGMKGYVFRTFVLDGVVEGDRVNVRLYPDIEAPVVAQLHSGESIEAEVSDANNKWLEIELPESSHFYIAKEYIENIGPVELIANMENRHREATHILSSAFLFAQSHIQKPFEQIDLDAINSTFEKLSNDYADLPDIADRVEEAQSVIQDIYVQKKIAFLESKSQRCPVQVDINPSQLDRLAKLGIEIQPKQEEKNVSEIAEAATDTIGYASTLADKEITDKMLIWQPLEESLFHLWAVANGEQELEEFYTSEAMNASMLSGIIEPYNRPVKNRPGDYLLRTENLPVAFLYSTKVNLDRLVGKRVTILASPRPNNNFAFPAYYVLSVE